MKFIIGQFKEIFAQVDYIERMMSNAEAFKGDKSPFKSPLLQSAYNEIRSARMFGIDCLRLLIWKNDARSNQLYSTQLNQLTLSDAPCGFEESLLLMVMVESIKRQVIYPLIDSELYKESPDSLKITYGLGYWDELKAYRDMFLMSLKKGSQYLELRLKELKDVPTTPELNNDDDVPKLVEGRMDAILTDIFNLAKDIEGSNLDLGEYENLIEVERAIHQERAKFQYLLRNLTIRYL
jgi:hypothetical protein